MSDEVKPLSDRAEILRLMRNGWELGRDIDFWIQKGGLCKGGESRKVHAATAHSMLRRGLIEDLSRPDEKFWLRRYQPAGGAAAGSSGMMSSAV